MSLIIFDIYVKMELMQHNMSVIIQIELTAVITSSTVRIVMYTLLSCHNDCNFGRRDVTDSIEKVFDVCGVHVSLKKIFRRIHTYSITLCFSVCLAKILGPWFTFHNL